MGTSYHLWSELCDSNSNLLERNFKGQQKMWANENWLSQSSWGI